MKDRLLEQYGDPTRVPLKSTEVAPGVLKRPAEHPVPVQKLFDQPLPSTSIGKDGKSYDSPEALRAANDLWKRANLQAIRSKLIVK